MVRVLHRADSRGQGDHGWLKSAHSFSFAHYHNPGRMGFGRLRVLNDDWVAPGKGFGTHPHRDMEIVSIPLSGLLHHQDSGGHEQIIQHGEVQIMSAGTGVFHSEYNGSEKDWVNFLQIWVMPEHLGFPPRYDQMAFSAAERRNKLQTIVSPLNSSEPGVKINQQAYFSLVDLAPGRTITYDLKRAGNGVYLFVISGEVEQGDDHLGARDALGLQDQQSVAVKALQSAQLLFIEVPQS